MPATTETVDVTVWILVDQDGDYVCTLDRDDLGTLYGEVFTELTSEITTRYVKVTVQVPKPRPVELTATIAAEPAVGELKVA
jgi:hypothetical protein